MIEITNQELLGKTIADALVALEFNPKCDELTKLRWVNAIARAAREIENRPEFLHFEDDVLLIWSESNEIYEANGVCQCKAFAAGQPCYHRAAARLIRNYLAAEAAPAPKPKRLADYPYLKRTSDKAPEKVGNIRI